MSPIGAAPRAAVPAPGAPGRAATPVRNARAEASRRNGSNSRGPKTPQGKARSAQNALKHGLRAQKYLVLPQEDALEFAGLEATLLEELAPVGALQTLLARRVAVAAWRLARADRMEAEVLEARGYDNASPGIALIRDGNGTRSFETLMRYRGAAMAEFMRALRTLKALQAGQAANATQVPAERPTARRPRRVESNEPEAATALRLDYGTRDPAAIGRALHEPAAPWLPNPHQPEAQPVTGGSEPGCRTNPAQPRSAVPVAPRRSPSAGLPGAVVNG